MKAWDEMWRNMWITKKQTQLFMLFPPDSPALKSGERPPPAAPRHTRAWLRALITPAAQKIFVTEESFNEELGCWLRLWLEGMFLPSKRFSIRCCEHLMRSSVTSVGLQLSTSPPPPLCLLFFPSTVWSTSRELLLSELLYPPVIIQSCTKLWVMRPFKFIDFFF